MKKGYKAVVESGSCYRSGKLWRENSTCGHLHRTCDKAWRCGDKLRANNELWHQFTIHHADGSRVTGQEHRYKDCGKEIYGSKDR